MHRAKEMSSNDFKLFPAETPTIKETDGASGIKIQTRISWKISLVSKLFRDFTYTLLYV